ncbi:MAG: hypothetical protein ACREBC_31575, partial [Pyrinomonadaceae bacterium]
MLGAALPFGLRRWHYDLLNPRNDTKSATPIRNQIGVAPVWQSYRRFRMSPPAAQPGRRPVAQP